MEGPAVNRVRPRPGRSSRLLVSAGALALVAICLLVGRAAAQAGGGIAGCGDGGGGTCVMMIQIDGLEATEVTPTKTPFLWELAHPTGGNPINDGRNGWIWQAPRATMGASLGANAASFLIGGYAEQTGIPADDFRFSDQDIVPEEDGSRIRLGGSDVPGSSVGIADFDAPVGDTVLRLVHDDIGGPANARTTAAFIGDPGLGPMIAGPIGDDEAAGVDFNWYPSSDDQQNPPNPALCDIPRSPTTPPGTFSACAASDATTLARAFQDLSAGDASRVTLTYIELAELGHVKRSGAAPGEVTATLQSTDAALQAFLAAYSQQQTTQDQWDRTILMLSGTSGYEEALPTKRVPDPDTAEPGQDLANDVNQFGGGNKFDLSPQGTLATVYALPNTFANDSPAAPSDEHRTQLAALKARIESVNNHASCQADDQPPAGPDLCIEEVLYARPNLTPDGSVTGTVKEVHPDWHLDPFKVNFDQQTGDTTTTPTGRGGDLVVVATPGWAFGKAAPADPTEATFPDPGEEVITNAYSASTGGPRNRAVAALINGPASLDVKRIDPAGWYPVAGSPEGTPDDPDCRSAATTNEANLGPANATPGDDANAPGHECQAETLDFAPTVAALLKVAMPPDQICGRILNEAFTREIVATQDTEGAPDAYFTQGPVTPPPGQQYPQTDRDVTFEFDTTIRNRAVVDCGESSTVATTFECSFDGAAYSACTSPVTLTGLSKGIHEFCVRAVSGDLPPLEPDCAKFEVILFFDFDGVLRDLRASVTDYDGNSWAVAPRGRRMNRIVISADYGRPLNGVTLTLYKQSSGKVLCGQTVFRPKTTAATAGAQVAGGARGAASCPLTGLARFKPFKLDRGHIDLRLRIPKAYKPTHVGVTVQEVRANVLDAVTASQCQQTGSFFCFYAKVGAPEGGIVQVVDARRLHKVKGQKCGKKRKGKKRKGKKRVRKAGKKKRKRTAKRCKKNKKKKKKKKK